ncbi:MAG TPA: glycerate kinase, partial [Bacteroidota bacterium]|nr:glycerate kinase [Bacteroidota bacterium]
MNLGRCRILVAPDSFKGSLSAAEAAMAMGRGVRRAIPGASVRLFPVSDGGEGFIDALLPVMGGTPLWSDVRGPLPSQRVRARWALVAKGTTAVIEMAAASGLLLVPSEERDPCVTTTFGVGELVRAALDRGVASILIGIGGSATNDGGAGMASALGVRFLDSSGAPLPLGGASLARLARIDAGGLDGRLKHTAVTVACDVANPLAGPEGASRVYGPQKGAGPDAVEMLDAALERYAGVLRDDLGQDVGDVPGSGAAGGLGAGLIAFCGARLTPGIDVVLDATGFAGALSSSDLVLTGEGRLDAQTRSGKALAGVLRRAREARVPVAAVAGVVEGAPGEYVGENGFVALESLVDGQSGPETAMRNAARLLEEKTRS